MVVLVSGDWDFLTKGVEAAGLAVRDDTAVVDGTGFAWTVPCCNPATEVAGEAKGDVVVGAALLLLTEAACFSRDSFCFGCCCCGEPAVTAFTAGAFTTGLG